MFTGIIEASGDVLEASGHGVGMLFRVSRPSLFNDVKLGDSIAVNGVCLTVKSLTERDFSADVSGETVRRTTFGRIRGGEKVNLERALRLSDRLGGHLVTGHIDGIGVLKDRRPEGQSVRLIFSLPEELSRYVIGKGSIAIDGISLTVNEAGDGTFSVNIIPHTAGITTITTKKPGDQVNLETDLIGKYVERLLKQKKGVVSEAFLAEHGFFGSK